MKRSLLRAAGDRKGSVTVFIMIFFVVLAFAIMVFLQAARETASRGAGEKLGRLWCVSVLAEYDRNLKNKYDLFGFYGSALSAEDRLDRYARETFRSSGTFTGYEGVSCSLSGYSLRDTKEFHLQVVSAGKAEAARKGVETVTGKGGKDTEKQDPDRDADAAGKQNTGSPELLMQDLPSGGSARSVTLSGLKRAFSGARTLPGLANSGVNAAARMKYIEVHYRDLLNQAESGKTYFHCEKEYLIAGKRSDAENKRAVRRRIVAVREVMNYLYLVKDEAKSAAALSVAELINPAAAPAIQQAILASWALVEAENDYQLLIHGEKVPFVKDDTSWAVSLERIFQGGMPSAEGKQGTESVESSGEKKNDEEEPELPEMKKRVPYIDPGNERGNTYLDYLKALIFLSDRDVVLLRMMDLIQINMKYTCYRDFEIRDYHTGLDATFRIGRQELKIRRRYEPAGGV